LRKGNKEALKERKEKHNRIRTKEIAVLSKRENEKEHIFTIEDCYLMLNRRSVFLSELIGINGIVFNYVSHRNLNCTACINSSFNCRNLALPQEEKKKSSILSSMSIIIT